MMNEFIYPLRVYIEDTDYGGIVYHSNYLKFMERARSEWAEHLGIGFDWQNAHKIYFAVYTAQLEYHKPARLNDKLEVVSAIKKLGPASITFEQYLRVASSADKMLFKAEIKVACVDHTLRPCLIPEVTNLTSIRRILK